MNKLVLGALSLVAAISLNATVFATVNDKNITEIELAPLLAGMQGQIDVASMPKEEKTNLINRAIELQLLIEKAKNSGITSEPVYLQELERAKDQIAFRVWEAKQFAAIKISDDEVKNFYNKNKDKFVEPAQVEASHILVKNEKDAQDIINQLKKLKGEELSKKFAEIAKAKSTDGSAQNGGDLGWFAAAQMIKPFSDAAFALKKGEITAKPVKTKFGYHVILKNDAKDKKISTLEDKDQQLKESIISHLKQEKYKVELEKMAEDARKAAKVEYK